jgi:hypothetical protein
MDAIVAHLPIRGNPRLKVQASKTVATMVDGTLH